MTARPMTRWPARRLIVGLAALTALFDLAVLLPGNPYSSRDEFVVAVVIQALVLVFGVIVVAINLLADLAYWAIDPRVRTTGAA